MTLRNWKVSYSHSPLSSGIPTLSYHSCLHPEMVESLPDIVPLNDTYGVANLAAVPLCLLCGVSFAHYIYCRVDV